MNKADNSQLTLRKSDAFGIITILLIIVEGAFENTDLQIYDLQIGRVLLAVEVACFTAYLCFHRIDKIGIALLLLGAITYPLLNSAIYIKYFIFASIVSGIGYKSSFKLLLNMRTVFIISIIVLSLIGIIDIHYTLVNKSGESIVGYGLGYTHPNRLASAVTYILFCYLLYNKDSLRKSKYITISIIVIVTYMITKSRTLIWCFVLFGIFLLLYNIRLTKEAAKKAISILGTVSIPVCVLMSVGIPAILMTANGPLQTVIYYINAAFSRRFTHVEHAFMAYPVSLFGGTYSFNEMDAQFGYGSVDNAYIRLLYSYGIVGLLIFCVVSYLCIARLIKKKEYYYVAVCTIVAIQGMLENVYMYIGLNILILFWAEMVTFDGKRRTETKSTDLNMGMEENKFQLRNEL